MPETALLGPIFLELCSALIEAKKDEVNKGNFCLRNFHDSIV